MRSRLFALSSLVSAGAAFAGFAACGGGSSSAPRDPGTTFPDASVIETPVCKASGGKGPVQSPVFVRNLQTGETGWFGSPAVYDLDHDGKNEIVVTSYSTFVFDRDGKRLAKGTATKGRIYAPGVVADLDGDGVTEIVVGGNAGTVVAYEWKAGALAVKSGWPADTTSAGQAPEARGMAAGDLDGDGKIEVVVTTTQTAKTGAQVFTFSPDGKLFQPKGVSFPAWPRYNTATGAGGDADFNGYGNHGYGQYGENVGIGNLDDDADLEIVTTYDNHQINVFNPDGSSVLASPWFTNRQTTYSGQRLGWGQFIRWLDQTVEDNHYHLHTGDWPDPTTATWLQWTASPPNVVDVNGDGKNDVVGIPNAEAHDPYVTQGYAFVVYEGAYGDGERSARRLAGFEKPFMSAQPAVRPDGDWYPPDGIPAPTTVSILGDARPEIIAPINDGYVYAVGPDGALLWKFDYAKGAPKTFASEVSVADLDGDGAPELVFGVYSLQAGGGRLVVLSNAGAPLFDLPLPNQGTDGNGIGVPAAPTIADLDGDGTLEILVATFDHGVDVFHVPGSGTSCVPWPTGRGSLLRAGSGPKAK
jgi:hypothetical protein